MVTLRNCKINFIADNFCSEITYVGLVGPFNSYGFSKVQKSLKGSPLTQIIKMPQKNELVVNNKTAVKP